MEGNNDIIRLSWVQGWMCSKELYITYQLISKGICDKENETDFPRLRVPLESLSSHGLYHYKLNLSKTYDLNLYADSTYLFTAQFIQWHPDDDYISGSRQDVYFNTSKGKHIL